MSSDLPNQSASLRSLIGLHFLRVAVALAAILSFVGAAILASFASPGANPQPGLVVIIFLPLAGLICMAWTTLNWMLSLAGIFAIRNDENALGAVSAAVTFSRERPEPIFAVSTWNGLAHLAAFFGASILASLLLAFLHIAPTRLVIAGVAVMTLAYFAIADWLYIARLAGYICIAEMPDALVSSPSSPVLPPADHQFPPGSPAQAGMDRDEPILSDVPSLYTGHLI